MRPASVFQMRNHQCSCGCGEPYRISPSAFPSALSMTFLWFPQVFSGFFRFCSKIGTFCPENPNKTMNSHYPPTTMLHQTKMISKSKAPALALSVRPNWNLSTASALRSAPRRSPTTSAPPPHLALASAVEQAPALPSIGSSHSVHSSFPSLRSHPWQHAA